MLDKKNYKNGQKIYELEVNKLSYFYKNGQLKAEGSFVDDKMEGQWKFYRDNGQLWQVGNFQNNEKDGHWLRYDRYGKQEYSAYFENGKLLKRKRTQDK